MVYTHINGHHSSNSLWDDADQARTCFTCFIQKPIHATTYTSSFVSRLSTGIKSVSKSVITSIPGALYFNLCNSVTIKIQLQYNITT